MDRNTARTVVLALLALVALSVAAATLNTAVTPSGEGSLGPAGSQDQSGVGESDDGPVGVSEPAAPLAFSSPSFCVSFLRSLQGIALFLLPFLGLFGLVYYESRSAAVSGVVTFALGLPAAMVYLLLTACHDAGGETSLSFGGQVNATSGLLPAGGGSGGSGGAGQALTTPAGLLGLVLVAAILGSVVLLVVSTGDDEEPTPATEDPPAPTADLGAVGRAAGEAADRIEGEADVDNQVYRAWVEMTDQLEVANPRASTPAEFAAAAVEAGMAREDVEELTALFEAVRYGGAAPTAEREERAVAALRRIEATYGDGGGHRSDGGSGGLDDGGTSGSADGGTRP